MSVECIMAKQKGLIVSAVGRTLRIGISSATGGLLGAGIGGVSAVLADKDTSKLTKILLPTGGLFGGAVVGLLVGILMQGEKLADEIESENQK